MGSDENEITSKKKQTSTFGSFQQNVKSFNMWGVVFFRGTSQSWHVKWQIWVMVPPRDKTNQKTDICKDLKEPWRMGLLIRWKLNRNSDINLALPQVTCCRRVRVTLTVKSETKDAMQFLKDTKWLPGHQTLTLCVGKPTWESRSVRIWWPMNKTQSTAALFNFIDIAIWEWHW